MNNICRCGEYQVCDACSELYPTRIDGDAPIYDLNAHSAAAAAWQMEKGYDNGGVSRKAFAVILRSYAEAFRQAQITEAALKASQEIKYQSENGTWYNEPDTEVNAISIDNRTFIVSKKPAESLVALNARLMAAAPHTEESGEICTATCQGCRDPLSAILATLSDARDKAWQRGNLLRATRQILAEHTSIEPLRIQGEIIDRLLGN